MTSRFTPRTGSVLAAFSLLFVSSAFAQAPADAKPSAAQDSGNGTTGCVEAVQSDGCQLRWEIDASGVSNSTSQTSTASAPNILFKLDYQIAQNKKTTGENGAQGFADRFNTHLIFKTGFTQIPTAAKIQPSQPSTSTSTTTSSTPANPMACSGTATAAPATCMAATPQQAFIAEAGGTAGFTFLQDGKGTYAEIGFGARGSIRDIVQSNQIVQSGGISYAYLSALNPKTTSAVYEGVFRFRLGAHDQEVNHVAGAATTYANNSDLVVIEAGYQNNSGLQQLATNPLVSTRSRFVARFYAYPVESSTNHTKMLVGLEYSGGINGGPKVIQIFWGTNINPARLFNPTPKTN
jgi:hypothetical protein